MAEGTTGGRLFDECVVCILQSKDLSASAAQILAKLIEEDGGTVVDPAKDGSINLNEVTHIVSETIDFRQYPDARDAMIPVVMPSWVKESNRKNKVAQIKPHTPDPRLIFSGVNFTIADIPDRDGSAIIGAAMAMGGQYTPGLTKMVTHIVALTMDNKKCQQALQKNLRCKIVLPHWFDDCFKIGHKIDDKPYVFPNPAILLAEHKDPVLVPDTPQIKGALTSTPTDIPTSTITARRLTVFDGKKIMLSEDLDIPDKLRGILEELIISGRGSIVSSVLDADIYIGRYRDGRDYVLASRTNKDVGSLAWLYFLITHNEWTSPLKRLLHYPVPRDGIPGFKDYKITLSNYGGEARVYLENLVVAAGGTFTKSMKQDNTHLITARKNSEKCDAALEWNISMVNHLWMEESYAMCEVQALTHERYTHYPPRTNLGEIIGQTELNKKILEKKYFPKDPHMSTEEKQLTRAMKGKDANARETKTPAAKKGKLRDSGTYDGAASGAESPTTSMPSRKRQSMITPASNRLTDKENETPSSTGSRGAKDRALSKLHDLAPDIALYEKEKKRNGKGIWGGKQAANRSEREMEEVRKRTSTSPMFNEDVDGSPGPDVKRRKTNGLPEIQIRLLPTGYTRWLDDSPHVHKEAAETKKLRNLGILITKDPAACTHMASPSIVRTAKFLTALAYAPIIVSSEFVDYCIENNKVPKVADFLLTDKKNEKIYGLTLKDSLARAKANGCGLLSDVAIYCTSKIANGPETYRKIAEVNGATFAEYNGRQGLRKPSMESQDQEEQESVYLITGSKPEEKKVWPRFKEMAREGGMNPRIVDPNWLLVAAMSQQLQWDEKYLVEEAQSD